MKQQPKKKRAFKPTHNKRGRDTDNGFILGGKEVVVERRRVAPNPYPISMIPRRTKMS